MKSDKNKDVPKSCFAVKNDSKKDNIADWSRMHIISGTP